MDTWRLKGIENAIREAAKRDSVTVAYVKEQIELAMVEAMGNSDPEVRAHWDSIPHIGGVPTPEELILYLSKLMQEGACPFHPQ